MEFCGWTSVDFVACSLETGHAGVHRFDRYPQTEEEQMAQPKTMIVSESEVREVQRCTHIDEAKARYNYRAPYGIEMELCWECVEEFDRRLRRKTEPRKGISPYGWLRLPDGA